MPEPVLLTPGVFYAAACVICGMVALATGSSWTTAGTIGVALIAIATNLPYVGIFLRLLAVALGMGATALAFWGSRGMKAG